MLGRRRRPHPVSKIEYVTLNREFADDMLYASAQRNPAALKRNRIEVPLNRASRQQMIPRPFERQRRLDADPSRLRQYTDHLVVQSDTAGKHDDGNTRRLQE